MASKLVRLMVIGGASALPRGAKATAGVDFFAAPPTGASLTVQAVFNPPMASGDAQAAKIKWDGDGQSGPVPFQRMLRADKVGRREVSCELDGVSRTAIVYVLGANPTNFRNKDSWSDDNKAEFVKNKKVGTGYELSLGVHPPAATSGGHLDTCEIQFTVVPPELLTDAQNDLFDKGFIHWRVTREAAETIWVQMPDGSGTLSWKERKAPSKYFVPAWTVDDDHTLDSDDDPWKTGHLYGTDAPGDDNLEKDDDAPTPTPGQAPKASGWQGYFAQRRFREFVVVGFGQADSSLADMQRCSDYQYWHQVRRLAKTNGRWAQDPKGPNEIAKDDRLPVSP